MELKVSRETLRFERLIAAQEEQIGVEGEATLPGSMRDAVTVLSVQAQAHMESIQAGEGKAILRGQVCFQTLYTQGDLTRIRTMETTCDFEHTVPVKGLGTDMRIDADAAVQETEGSAANGRMTLRALLGSMRLKPRKKSLSRTPRSSTARQRGKSAVCASRSSVSRFAGTGRWARTRRSFGRNSICLPSSAWATYSAHRARQRLQN